VGFGVGAFTHIFTHEVFGMAISRALLLFFSNRKKLFTRSHFVGYDI